MELAPNRIIEKLTLFWAEQGWNWKESKFLLAVSGGKDSMLMAHLFLHLKINFQVAHANFQLRGEESNDEEEFVRSWCQKNEVKFHVKKFSIHATKNNTQLAAREARYEWFSQLLSDDDFDALATAHHLKDSVESFIINFGRGTGLAGLTGIPVNRDKIIRPLACLSPDEIESLINWFEISWREDSSNQENKYLRNKIRNTLLPHLEEIFPNFYSASHSNFERLQNDQILINEKIDQYKAELIRRKKSLIEVDLKKIESHLAKESILYYLLKTWHFNAHQGKQIWQSYEKHQDGAEFFSPDASASLRNNILQIDENPLPKEASISVDIVEDKVLLPDGYLAFEIIDRPISVPDHANEAYLDLEKLTWPITLRLWRAGDKFQPFGMKGKHQKLQDFFSNKKFSISEKNRQWLLCSDGQIAWVIGHRIADPFAIHKDTKQCLKVNWVTNQD